MKHLFKKGEYNLAKRPDIRKKIRLSKLGKKRSEETKQKIRETLKHRTLSEEHKENIKKSLSKLDLTGENNPNWKGGDMKICPYCGETFKGQNVFCTMDCFVITMMKRIGENNPNWKGGISDDPYCSGWKQLAPELKEDDNNECQNPLCEGLSKRNTSHHIDYNKEHCHPSNIITLCNSCNAKANSNRDWWQSFYTEIKRRNL